MLSGAWASFEDSIFRLQFGGNARVEFYEGLKNLVENGVPTSKALSELYSVWSDGGKKKSVALAVICKELMAHMADGGHLSDALSRWAPHEEVSLLAAGEHAAKEAESFDDCIRVIAAKQRIRGALATAIIYPAFLTFPLSVLLWVISSKLVPAMVRVSDPATWSGAAYALYLLATFVSNYGIAFACFLVALAIAFTYSLPRWTKRFAGARILADKGPFYSTYRMVQGSTFLLNLAVLMRAGVPTNKALDHLEKYATPWLKDRIQGAQYGVRQGMQLGVALQNAGHGFPDKKAIQFIRILGEREGFDTSISRYAERWLENSIKRVSVFAEVAKNTMFIIIGLVMALIVVGTQDMQSGMAEKADRASQTTTHNAQ